MGNGVSDNDPKRHHAAERKRPLGNGNRNQASPPETVLHCSLEAVTPAQLAIDDDQADRPIHRDCQADQQHHAREQARLAQGVRLPDDAGADDRVGHVHERRPQPGLGPLHLLLGPLVHIVLVAPGARGHGDRGRFDVREQRHDVPRARVAAPGKRRRRVRGRLLAMIAGVSVAVHACEVESHSIGGSGGARLIA